jgi:hypothetical protein
MMVIVGCFVAAFLVGTTFGYNHGLEFVRRPDVLEEYVFRNVEIVEVVDPSVPASKQNCLVSRHEGRPLQLYRSRLTSW